MPKGIYKRTSNMMTGKYIGNKGKKLSEDSKKKLSIANKNNPLLIKTQFKKGHISWNKDKKGLVKMSAETRIKMSETAKKNTYNHIHLVPAQKGHLLGRKVSEEVRLKISLSKKGITPLVVLRGDTKGEKNPNWRGGSKEQHKGIEYNEWRLKVYKRDNFKCKINDKECKGKLEAHHILTWSEFPQLRYEINNGITLCHAHHPRKRAEEKRLAPVFFELVSVS